MFERKEGRYNKLITITIIIIKLIETKPFFLLFLLLKNLFIPISIFFLICSLTLYSRDFNTYIIFIYAKTLYLRCKKMQRN